MGLFAYHDYRYSVVDTDYENYALIYSCLKFDGKNEENAFVLSRKRSLDETQIVQLKSVLNRQYNTDSLMFKKTEQKTCTK